MTTDRYGSASQATIDMVALWWYAVPLTPRGEYATLDTDDHAMKALTLPGIYAFEGRHDTRAEGGILYVGRVGKKRMNSMDAPAAARALRERIEESGARFVWKDGGKSGLYADVWDIVVRFAVVDPEVIERVESLLIRAHAPSFNAQQVRGPVTDPRVLTCAVMNGGAKGRLLPAVAGRYYDQDFWRRTEGG